MVILDDDRPLTRSFRLTGNCYDVGGAGYQRRRNMQMDIAAPLQKARFQHKYFLLVSLLFRV